MITNAGDGDSVGKEGTMAVRWDLLKEATRLRNDMEMDSAARRVTNLESASEDWKEYSSVFQMAHWKELGSVRPMDTRWVVATAFQTALQMVSLMVSDLAASRVAYMDRESGDWRECSSANSTAGFSKNSLKNDEREFRMKRPPHPGEA